MQELLPKHKANTCERGGRSRICAPAPGHVTYALELRCSLRRRGLLHDDNGLAASASSSSRICAAARTARGGWAAASRAFAPVAETRGKLARTRRVCAVCPPPPRLGVGNVGRGGTSSCSSR